MSFIQIVSFTTDDPTRITKLSQRWSEETAGRNTLLRERVYVDRDDPRRFVAVNEFASSDDARVNSELPETSALAAELAGFVSDLTYTDLDEVSLAAPEQPVQDTETEAGALVEEIFGQTVATLELATVWLGLKLGLYDAVATGGTSTDVAGRAGIIERYAREWLEQQTIAGLVSVDDPGAAAEERRYYLSEAQRLTLADADSPFYAGAMALLAGGCGSVLPRVLEAWRNGTGVAFGEYGDDVRLGQGLFNKGDFVGALAQDWVPAMPEVAALVARPGARALDLGCGVGWSSISLARAFPGLAVLGVDSDEASILDARRNAAEAGLADRVTFEVARADEARPTASIDVAFFLESLHDMAHPVEALTVVRQALRDGGRVVVMDERAEEEFAPNGSPVERLFAAGSVLHCLPVGLSEPGSAGTGALFRPATMRAYAGAAGYADVVLPDIEHDVMRFYLLRP